jgi:hypothetical protein
MELYVYPVYNKSRFFGHRLECHSTINTASVIGYDIERSISGHKDHSSSRAYDWGSDRSRLHLSKIATTARLN